MFKKRKREINNKITLNALLRVTNKCLLLLLLFNINLYAKENADSLSNTSSSIDNLSETRLTKLSRLIPQNPIKANTGDPLTDKVFSNYTLDQIQLMIQEYTNKMDVLKSEKDEFSDISLEVGNKFLNIFAESDVIDELVIRQADLLYEKSVEDFDRKYIEFANKSLEYAELLDKYDRGEVDQKPIEPNEPDYGFQKVIDLYDLIINNMPESPYVVDALYGKAYVYGENIPNKRNEAISILREITRKYPDSRYNLESYMLIAEYLFDSPSKFQPRKTIESIPYYKKVLGLVSQKNSDSKYYDQVLYKLGWAYFRIGNINSENYLESIIYFTSLCDDLEKAQEIYAGETLPDFVDPRLKDEALEYIAVNFVSIQKKIDDQKSAVDRVEKYFSKLSPKRRYEPIVYEKLGEAYEDLLEDPNKIINVYKTLLKRFPEYEKAPFIAQKVIKQLDQATLEEGRTDRDELEIQLYNERMRLFYDYGRNSKWYDNLKKRIELQSRGDTSAYASFGTSRERIDPSILEDIDQISKEALFQNIVYGVSRAQLLDGSIEPPLGIVVNKDQNKAKELYEQVVKDVDNYAKFFSRYDSTAYYSLFQKSFILDTKLNKKEEALDGYLNIAQNFAWDYFRKPAIINAYVISTEQVQSKGIAQFTPGIDTMANFSGKADTLLKDEQDYVSVLETLVRLYPHDSLAVPSLQVLSSIYLAKGYTTKYKEVNSRLLQYYPIQHIDPGILVSLSDYALFEEKDYVKSEQLAKALYYGPSGDLEKDKKRKEFAYNRIGESITQQAEYYKAKENYLLAAKQFERAAIEVPEWKEANQATVLASDNYVLAGRTEDAVRVNNYLINKAGDNPEFKVKAYKGIVLAYEKSENYDSLSKALENIADEFPDSTELAEESLKKSIKASMRSESWKNAIRVTDKYLERFPDSEEAPDIAFNKIDLNTKLGNDEGVFDSYGEFADRYVDKPLSVKAYFRRGEYLERKDNVDSAKVEYEKAINRSEKLKGQADIWASESLYKLTSYLVEDYKATPVSMIIEPSAYVEQKKSKTTKAKAKTKKDIAYDNKEKLELKDKIGNYTVKLIKLGGYRVIDAYYTPGFLSENLADNYSSLPDTLYKATNSRGQKIKDSKRDLNIAQANVDASQGYTVAGNDYSIAYKNLTKAKEKVLEEQKGASVLDTTSVQGDSLAFANIDTTSLKYLNDVIDSLLTNTGNVPDNLKLASLNATIDKTKSKISEMYYKAGQMKESSIYLWLNAKVPEEDRNKEIKRIKRIKLKNPLFIGDITELLTLSKIASDYVQPSTVDAIKTYEKGIENSKKLELQNEYVDLSNQAIIKLAPKAAERIDSLARVSGLLFDKLDKEYRDKLASIESFKTDDQIDLTLKIEKMKLVITNYNNLATSAVAEYYNTYQLLKDVGATETKLNALADTATKFIFELGDKSMSRSENFERYSKEFAQTFNNDFNKYWYSDAEAPYKNLSGLWKIAAQNVLGQVVDFVDEFKFQSKATQQALRRLVNSDPRKFSIGQDSKKLLTILTNSDWKIAKDVTDDKWYSKDYDDNSWEYATVNEGSQLFKYVGKFESIDTSYFVQKNESVSPIWFKKISKYQPQFIPQTIPDTSSSIVPNNTFENESMDYQPESTIEEKTPEETLQLEGDTLEEETSEKLQKEDVNIQSETSGQQEEVLEEGSTNETPIQDETSIENTDSKEGNIEEESVNVEDDTQESANQEETSDEQSTIEESSEESVNVEEDTQESKATEEQPSQESVNEEEASDEQSTIEESSKEASSDESIDNQEETTTEESTDSNNQENVESSDGSSAAEENSKESEEAPDLWNSPAPEYLNSEPSSSGEETGFNHRYELNPILRKSKYFANSQIISDSTLVDSSSSGLNDQKPLLINEQVTTMPDSTTIQTWLSSGATKDSLGVWTDTSGVVLFNPASLLPPPEPDPDFVFFRKSFDYDGATDIAQLVISSEISLDSLEIYINGDFIEAIYNEVPLSILEEVEIDSTVRSQQTIIDISKFVIDGKNTIAIKAPGKIEGTGLQAMINILYFAKLTDEQIKILVKQISKQRKEARKALEQPDVEDVQNP